MSIGLIIEDPPRYPCRDIHPLLRSHHAGPIRRLQYTSERSAGLLGIVFEISNRWPRSHSLYNISLVKRHLHRSQGFPISLWIVCHPQNDTGADLLIKKFVIPHSSRIRRLAINNNIPLDSDSTVLPRIEDMEVIAMLDTSVMSWLTNRSEYSITRQKIDNDAIKCIGVSRLNPLLKEFSTNVILPLEIIQDLRIS